MKAKYPQLAEVSISEIIAEIKKAKDQATDAYNQMAASVEAVKQNLLNDEELIQLQEEIARLEKAEKELDSQLKAISKDLQWFDANLYCWRVPPSAC